VASLLGTACQHRSAVGRQFTLEARSVGIEDRSNLSDSAEMSYRSDVYLVDAAPPLFQRDYRPSEPVSPGFYARPDWRL